MDYKELKDGLRYITIEGDRIYLFVKEPQGMPDPKIGAFKTLNDAVVEFNSESVKTALKQYADKKVADEKTKKRDENRKLRISGGKEAVQGSESVTDAEIIE
jgi:hypothetical protein